MYHVVIDTNVLIAAIRSKRGASYHLLDSIGDSRWQATISVALILEYEAVGRRETRALGLQDWVLDSIVDMICATARQHRIHFSLRPLLPDPDDEFILELAAGSRCDFIVTHNIKDFRGAEQFGIRVVTPGEFLRIIRKEEP